MAPGFHAQACCFYSNKAHGIFVERMEEAHRVASSADTGHQIIRKPTLFLQDLLPGFPSDDRLKIPYHHRIGMRSDHRADEIIGVPDICDPIPNRLVDGIFQRLAPDETGMTSAPEASS